MKTRTRIVTALIVAASASFAPSQQASALTLNTGSRPILQLPPWFVTFNTYSRYRARIDAALDRYDQRAQERIAQFSSTAAVEYAQGERCRSRLYALKSDALRSMVYGDPESGFFDPYSIASQTWSEIQSILNEGVVALGATVAGSSLVDDLQAYAQDAQEVRMYERTRNASDSLESVLQSYLPLFPRTNC